MPPSSPISVQQSVQQSMPSLQNRKRLNTDNTTQDSPPTKRIKKSTSAARIALNFPPKFWDNLSKVWLTSRALREKDRRNSARPPAITLRVTPTTLARFARRGGPDLCHLRGYPEPKHTAPMSSNRLSTVQSTKAASVSSKAKRSSAYDRDFEQKLIDHNIYPKGYEYPDDMVPEPGNLNDITQTLSAPRGSLSPSYFNRAAFKAFTLVNDRVISEGNVMAKILPTILGDAEFPSEGNLPFTNLDSITDGTTVDAVPDLYDGLYPKDVNKTVRQDLNKTIVPTTHRRAPVLPNFYVEAKAPRGGADVAKRQACLDGAIGARAMHSLQTYNEEKPAYDGNAYAFSSTYHDGTLKIYTHHVTAPTAEGEQAEYHMTQLRTFGMTDTRETFIAGATAVRNARDLARRHREDFMQAAKTKVPQQQELQEDYLSHRHVEDSETGAWQDSHDDLEQHVAETHGEVNEDHGDAPATPQQQQQYSSDESDDQGQNTAASVADDPSTRSFTSSFNTDSTRLKRSRLSFSSPTQGSRSSKSRSRFTTTRQPAVSPAKIGEPGSSDSDVFY